MTKINPAFLSDLENAIINGSLDFWQRGFSFSSPASGSFTADRFSVFYDGTPGTFVVSKNDHGLSDLPWQPRRYIRWQQSVAGSGDTVRALRHKIEGVRSYANKTVSISLWGNATGSAVPISVGIQQFFGTGGSPSSPITIAPISKTVAVGTWTKYTFSFTMPDIIGKTVGTNNNDCVIVNINLPLNSTFDVSLSSIVACGELLSTPEFIRHGGSYQAELESCQRFFEKSYDIDTPPATVSSAGAQLTSANFTVPAQQSVSFYIRKRAAVTPHLYSDVTGTIDKIRDLAASSDQSVSYPQSSASNFVFLSAAYAPNGVSYHYTAEAEL